jgi:hypothetical protein
MVIKMTEAKIENTPFLKSIRKEIDWTQYLDFTRFIEEDTDNEQLDKFRNDFDI